MKSNTTFDFAVDKATHSIRVKRELATTLSTAWDVFTKPKLLDQWWAPKPYRSKTKSMEFKEGGRRLYAMVGPNGEEHWALADYAAITPQFSFTYLDGFCDEAGNINSEMPRSHWNLNFIEVTNLTKVDITITYNSLEDLEKIIALGFREGFSIALDGLDEILLTPKK